MDNTQKDQQHNQNVEGYKVPGDGNAPNKLPEPGNQSFDENPHAMTHKTEAEIPGKEFNIGDKAYHDSSKHDFIKTVSNHHHANEIDVEQLNVDAIDMSYKKPDGDR